jgi:hypothetical protein
VVNLIVENQVWLLSRSAEYTPRFVSFGIPSLAMRGSTVVAPLEQDSGRKSP